MSQPEGDKRESDGLVDLGVRSNDPVARGRAFLGAQHPGWRGLDPSTLADTSLEFGHHRSNSRDHVSFGHGPHYCIGANLARAEFQESLRVLTASLRCPKIVGRPVMATTGFPGPTELRLDFERRATPLLGDQRSE